MKTYSKSSLSITICGYEFDGPYANPDALKDTAGVYVVLDKRSDGKWYPLDVGESEQVRTRLQNHDRASCWQRNRKGPLGFAACYTPGWTADQRRALEKKIRDTYDPPCGKQ